MDTGGRKAENDKMHGVRGRERNTETGDGIYTFYYDMKLFWITTLLISIQFTYSQEINGTYYFEDESITFNNQTIEFDMFDGGCLSVRLRGIGNYELIEDYLLIYTVDYKKKKSLVETSKCEDKNANIYITNELNQELGGVSVVFYDGNDKIINGAVTNFNGKATLPKDYQITKLHISFIGYNTLTTEFKLGTDYKVIMDNGIIIENETVLFKLKKPDNNSISICLLDRNFEKVKNRLKKMKKLEKKHNRNYSENRLFTKIKELPN